MGLRVGLVEGIIVGREIGIGVGEWLAPSEGLTVGALVGINVGETVRVGVGKALGAGVVNSNEPNVTVFPEGSGVQLDGKYPNVKS